MFWTADRVKADLPPVVCQVGRNRYATARLSGRLNPVATVTIWNEVRGGQTPYRDWHFSWEAVARSLNNAFPLVLD